MQDSIRHAEQLLERAEVVTLAVAGGDGYPRAYVMTKLPGEGIRTFQFLAKEGSEKVQALEKDPRACVSYFAPGGSVSLIGDVRLIREGTVLRQLWVPELDRIFPAGPDSGELVLIRFESRAATFCFMGKVEDHQL